jgi:hypothetical protein
VPNLWKQKISIRLPLCIGDEDDAQDDIPHRAILNSCGLSWGLASD